MSNFRIFGRSADRSRGLKCRSINFDSRSGPPRFDVNTRLLGLRLAVSDLSSNLRRRANTQFWSLIKRRLRSRFVSSMHHPPVRHSSVFETLTVPRSRLKSVQVSARYSLGRIPVVSASANKVSYSCPDIAAMNCFACPTSNTVKRRRGCRGKWTSSAGFVRRSLHRIACL